MSSRLWRAYFENDLEKFTSLLGLSEDRTGGTHDFNAGSMTNGSPFDLSSLQRTPTTFIANSPAVASSGSKTVVLNRFQINSRLPANIAVNPLAPATGITLLHHAATANKLEFAEALLKHPQIDLFLQDFESGWTVLHREGSSPFELFESTIKVDNAKLIAKSDTSRGFEDGSDDEDAETEQLDVEVGEFKGEFLGDEAFVWGSNKNLSLGFSDGDDRQFPERMAIPNPDATVEPRDALLALAPVYVKEIQMAKFHTAILTTAISNNLYVCGHGPGGRLGLGHENTEFTFKRVILPRKVRTVALGESHTIAVMENGDIFSWGAGRYGQLGYPANIDKNDKEEYQLIPRQVFTNLRKEKIIGAAASRHHSVVQTTTCVFVFGKNEGQLGLVDADARTLEAQTSPRKVASAAISEQPISMVTATDKATVILLENHDVWVLMNYGVLKLGFPFERFPNSGLKPTRPTSRYQSRPNFITKVSSGGGTIAALSRMGDVFTVNIDKTAATTTRSLPVPQRIWSLRKRHMAVRDIDVGQEGAVIICTESGSVWQRTRRSKVKEAGALGGVVPGTQEQLDRAKDYKFTRIPGLTHITAVRSNAFGSFAAIRRDVDVLKTQLGVREATLWDDLGSLISFYDDELNPAGEEGDTSEQDATRTNIERLRDRAMEWFLQKDFVNVLKETIHEMDLTEYDTVIKSDELDNMGISIPAHSFLLTGRCPRLRSLFAKATQSHTVQHDSFVELDHHPGGTFDIKFKGVNWFSLLIFIFYLYKDVVISVWTRFTRNKEQTQLFQRVRTDLGLLSKHFGLQQLAAVASGLYTTKLTLNLDLEEALTDPLFLETGDMLLELKDKTIKVHSSLLCARCSFFDALYHGGSGRWLASRKGEEQYATDQLVRVDMKHIPLQTMEIALKFLYSDRSVHLFDKTQVAKDGLDGFIDLVIDVLGVANELMLDRLVEVCQRVIGRLINTRNATSILAAISESSVSSFKDICLEYIFRNLDTMMETHALDELDADLMAELDDAVKSRQLAYMPITRSGRAEADLLQRHPHLVTEVDTERQAQLQLFDHGQINNPSTETDLTGSLASYRQSSSFRAGSYEKNKRRRSSKSGQEKPSVKSPPLMPAQGSELIFDMDDEDPATRLAKTPTSHSPGFSRGDSYSFRSTTPKGEVWYDCKGKQISVDGVSSDEIQSSAGEASSKLPWTIGSGIQSTKLDMREIMVQASKNRTSNLSLGLSSTEPTAIETLPTSNFTAPITAKISQKERKRQQQQQQLQVQQAATIAAPVLSSTPDKPVLGPKASPWKAIRSTSNPLSLHPTSPLQTPRKEIASNKILDVINTPPSSHLHQPGINTSPKHITSPRQPSFNTPKQSLPTPPPQIQTRRYNSSGDVVSALTATRSVSSPMQPRSEHYEEFPPISARLEQLNLPLAEIIQQEQIQQDIIKGKAPKQSLQEIQQEQEFLDWWEKESERYQQEEVERQVVEQTQKVGTTRGRGRGGGAARGTRGKIRGRGGQAGNSNAQDTEKAVAVSSKRGGADGGGLGRGRRRGRGKAGQENAKPGESSVKV
ncbi:hypothetical protein ABW20_dc0110466 [Dactylellina cionopaga]|nr:hypothetical protein ABW20_dc0110466 [Dactylellina cionopaga]